MKNNFLSKQTEKGITLVALVVTIVVLLILAGVSLDTFLGESGIIQQSKQAKEQTEIKEEREVIEIAHIALEKRTLNTTISAQDMEDEINMAQGANTVKVTGDGLLTVKFLKSNRLYEVDVDTGNIKDNVVDVEAFFATATKPEEQVETDDIGIAEDGTIVNLDLWKYTIRGEKTVDLAPPELGSWGGPTSYSSYGYKNILKGEEIPLQEVEGEDGQKYYTIYGKIPMYIKIEGVIHTVKYMTGTFYNIEKLSYVPEIPNSVIDMYFTFAECTKLTTAPELPSSVTTMYYTFYECTNLITVPEIPNGVTNMIYTFLECTNLTTAPEIPNTVKNMNGTFSGCINLITAPEIPNGVTKMAYTFRECTNLITVPEIPNGVTDMDYTFDECTNLTTAPEIPNTVENMYGTFSGCINLIKAPRIPNNVTQMGRTFYGCTNLSGTLTINANPTSCYNCLYGAATNSTLKLNGTSTKLNEILATKSSNSNITIEGQ